MRALQLLVLALAVELVTPDPAYAYIDPSAGSLIFQVAAGVILGGMLTAHRWWTSVGNASKLIWDKIRGR